ASITVRELSAPCSRRVSGPARIASVPESVAGAALARNSTTAPTANNAATTVDTSHSGSRVSSPPNATAMTVCSANATDAPANTARPENRVVSTSVVTVVLSGSSASVTSTNAPIIASSAAVIVDRSPLSSDTIKAVGKNSHRVESANLFYVPMETIFPEFRTGVFAVAKFGFTRFGTMVLTSSGRSHLPRVPRPAGQWWRGSSGASEMAVRGDHHLPLPDGAVDDRTVHPR